MVGKYFFYHAMLSDIEEFLFDVQYLHWNEYADGVEETSELIQILKCA